MNRFIVFVTDLGAFVIGLAVLVAVAVFVGATVIEVINKYREDRVLRKR